MLRRGGQGEGVPMRTPGEGALPGENRPTNLQSAYLGKQRRHKQPAAYGVPWTLAERAGFEPAEVLPSHDFQSCALGRTMLPLPDWHHRGHYTIVVLMRQIWFCTKAVSMRGGVRPSNGIIPRAKIKISEIRTFPVPNDLPSWWIWGIIVGHCGVEWGTVGQYPPKRR